MSRTKGAKNKQKKQFCVNKHDISVHGRNKIGQCRICIKIYKRSRNQVNKVFTQKYNWRIRGILNSSGTQFTKVDYDRLYQIQQGQCAICKKHQTDLKRAFDVDHDHKTGFVRGLLCTSCNRDVGVYERSRFNIARYLKRSPLGGEL